MNTAPFFFHDLTQFPIVISRHGNAPQGYSATWIREMELLTSNPKRFVMIVPDMNTPTAHEDRKAMIAWQTTHMEQIKARCLAFIAIEPDPLALEKIRKQGEKMTRAFGVSFLVAQNPAQAMARAQELLARQAPDHPGA